MRKVTITKEMAAYCRGVLLSGFARYFTPDYTFAYKMIANNALFEIDIDAKKHIVIGDVSVPDSYVATFYHLLETLANNFPVNAQKNTGITKEEANVLESKLKEFLPYSMNDLRYDTKNRTATIFTRWFDLRDHPIETFVDECLKRFMFVVENDIKQANQNIASYQEIKYNAEKQLTELRKIAKMAE